MSVADRRRQDLDSSLSFLTLSTPHTPRKTSKAAVSAAPDSWEDDTSSETEASTPTTSDCPGAPPPTPISPTSISARQQAASSAGATWSSTAYAPGSSSWSSAPQSPDGERSAASGLRDARGEARPEKTTAVAGRMIAGALGVRAPKKTEEARAYEKAVREKEVKRREKDREAGRKEEEERRKAREAVWEG